MFTNLIAMCNTVIMFYKSGNLTFLEQVIEISVGGN